METEEKIQAAQTPATFDVLAFIEATAYPTDEVVVFGAAKEATDYVKLADKKKQLKDAKPAEIKKIDEQLEALKETISKSAIIFTLRGMPAGIVQKIIEVPEDEEPDKNAIARDNELIAKTIVGARNADGVEDPRGVWQAEDVAKLRFFLKEGEFGKLAKAVGGVNFNAMVFDEATDAGFSSGRSDVE